MSFQWSCRHYAGNVDNIIKMMFPFQFGDPMNEPISLKKNQDSGDHATEHFGGKISEILTKFELIEMWLHIWTFMYGPYHHWCVKPVGSVDLFNSSSPVNWVCIGSGNDFVTYSVSIQYLHRCWLIVNWSVKKELRWSLNQNTKAFIWGKSFENVICKISTILSRGISVQEK